MSPNFLPLRSFGFGRYRVFGGRYVERPANMAGVKMAKEVDRPYTISIPTEDFKTPDPVQFMVGLEHSVDLIRWGVPVYVGCWGGIGRTGLFLAALAKLWGESDPVGYVRKHYNDHAVETPDQMRFVKLLKFSKILKRKVLLAKIRGLWTFQPTKIPPT